MQLETEQLKKEATHLLAFLDQRDAYFYLDKSGTAIFGLDEGYTEPREFSLTQLIKVLKEEHQVIFQPEWRTIVICHLVENEQALACQDHYFSDIQQKQLYEFLDKRDVWVTETYSIQQPSGHHNCSLESIERQAAEEFELPLNWEDLTLQYLKQKGSMEN